MKKLIAFDQDDTLNITKLPIDEEMAHLLKKLLDNFKVCIISGTDWGVMKKNDIDPLLNLSEEVNFKNYYIMPTTGTQFWRYAGEEQAGEDVENGWKREYAHFLSDEQVLLISENIEKAAKDLGYWCESPAGEIIENRGSQVTFSALGQWATPEEKRVWDTDLSKRKEIIEQITPIFDESGIIAAIGGSTSIDVTLPGIDKAYAIDQLMKETKMIKEDILFLGDKLQPGGNDYPVKTFGIDTIEVQSCEDTKWVLRGLNAIQ
ncbi:MAG: HAD-IIB family hydrolase [Streptococcaceae bacterium]|jgi:HAD superfamily hydrolase (TIGR01484 family)|nr:HAD-IIB family hydrolase [Streptococcaceae bacterium]